MNLSVLIVAVLVCVGLVGALVPPIIPESVLEAAYEQVTGHREALPQLRKMATVVPDHQIQRTAGNPDVGALIKRAQLAVGKSEGVYESDIQKYWPQAHLESRQPMTYILDLYLLNGDGGLGPKILTASGDFNSSLVCSVERGCAFLNERSTILTLPDGTVTPVAYDQALFLFTSPGEMGGIDNALDNSGKYGNTPPPPFGSMQTGQTPIFRNVVNKGAIMTADSFSTKPGFQGGDAGVGGNYYFVVDTFNFTTFETTTTLNIDSVFNLVDPASGATILKGDQRTTGSLIAPGLPI